MGPIVILNGDFNGAIENFKRGIREGAKFIGPHPWHSNRGAKSFSEKK